MKIYVLCEPESEFSDYEQQPTEISAADIHYHNCIHVVLPSKRLKAPNPHLICHWNIVKLSV